MSMKNTVLITELYPKIAKAYQTNANKINLYLSKFFEVRSKDIHDIGPFERIYFNQSDIDNYFKALGMREEEVAEIIKKTYYGSVANFNPKAAQDPLCVTVILAIRYYLLKKDRKRATLMGVFLCFSGKFYASIHYSSFRKFTPAEYRHVMEYAVNNMMTNKHELKQSGDMYTAIVNIVNRWLDKYPERFNACEDDDVVYLIQQLRTREASFIQNIAEVYYEAYKMKDVYLSYDTSSMEEDNFHIATNDTYIASEYIDKAMDFITTKGVNYELCMTASSSDVQPDEVKSIIASINSSKEGIVLVRELVSLLIYEYMLTSKSKTVTGLDFIHFACSPKSNTNNKNLIRIKQITETLLMEYSTRYKMRKKRPQTKSNYEKCILRYYSFCVNYANK